MARITFKERFKSIPRVWFFVILSILLLWTLSFSTLRTSTTTGVRISSSVHDFMINQKIKPFSATYSLKNIRHSIEGVRGLDEMRESDVAILGAGKNVAEHLPTVLKQIEILCSFFQKSVAVFVEGDSSDNTKAILKSWTDKSPQNRTLLLLYNQTFELEKTGHFIGLPLPREGRIAAARNLGLKYLRNLPKTKYTIVIDLDQIGWDIGGIIDSFSRRNWDVMCAHGTLLHGIYRDEYAFRNEGVNTNHHRCGDDYQKYNLTIPQKVAFRRDVKLSKAKVQRIMTKALTKAYNSRINSVYDDSQFIALRKVNNSKFIGESSFVDKVLVPAQSCFGGLGIYRTEALNGCEYSFRHEEFPYFQDCEHVLLHKCMIAKNRIRIYSNPFMKLWYGHNPITRGNIEKEFHHLIHG